MSASPPLKKAQTLEQRRRNAKFAKDQEARMGRSEEQVKKRVKEAPKSSISMFWIGTCPFSWVPFPPPPPRASSAVARNWLTQSSAILGFVVFGGLMFEGLARMFGR